MSMRKCLLFVSLVIAALAVATAANVLAQQSSGQQTCVNKLNKDGRAVAKGQGKENFACLKGVGAGSLSGTAQACLTNDTKGKVAAKKNKTTSDDVASCTPAPTFGYTGGTAVNAAAQGGQLGL